MPGSTGATAPTIPFLGETVIVVLDPRAGTAPGGAILNTDASALPGVPRLTLHVGLRPCRDAGADPRRGAELAAAPGAAPLRGAMPPVRRTGCGVRYTRLALSSAQTRWGSANANGSIRLNWRLIHFALPTIDYVVAHELAHLREMNHSPRFWDVVRSVLPEFERARGELRSDALPSVRLSRPPARPGRAREAAGGAAPPLHLT